ncbi:MAG: hypothetical protein ABI199_00100 [Bacteroidia bacterium]
MSKKNIFLLLLILFSLQSFAQYDEDGNQSGQRDSVRTHRPTPQPKPDFWSHTYTGGNFGLQFGTETLVDISPLFGYRVSDQFAVGVGITYEYYHYQDSYYNFVSSVYGGRAFAEYFLFDNIFAHAEYEVLNIPTYDYFNDRINLNSVLVGGGYSQPFGNNSSYVIMILFDVNQSPNSIYINPIFRAGFTIGL